MASTWFTDTPDGAMLKIKCHDVSGNSQATGVLTRRDGSIKRQWTNAQLKRGVTLELSQEDVYYLLDIPIVFRTDNSKTTVSIRVPGATPDNAAYSLEGDKEELGAVMDAIFMRL